MKPCPNCATKNAPTAVFCSQCGVAIAQVGKTARPVQLVTPSEPKKKKGGGVFWIALVAIAVIGGISAQGTSKPVSSRAVEAGSPSASQAAAVKQEQGVELHILSDSKATYHVLAVEPGPKGLVYIRSKRTGPSGVSFSERQVNCGANTFAYTREGDTLEALLAEPREPDPMGPRVEGSISDVVSQYACDNPPTNRKAVAKNEVELRTSGAGTPIDQEQPKNSGPGGKDDLWIAVTQNAVQRSVREPSSATFRNVKLYRPFPGQDTPVVCGEVNSKNGFGGMSGFQGFIGSGSGESFPVILEEQMAAGEYAKAAKQLCINA